MIKTESTIKVKVLITLLFLWILSISSVFAKIQEIEAEEFEVKLQKISRSGQVILLEDPSENNPKPGKILLLKNNQEQVVAIRVLRNFPGTFAAKIVLPFQTPVLNEKYRALKKLGDKLMAQIEELERKTKQDKTDEELVKEVAPVEAAPKEIAPITPPPPQKPVEKPLFDKEGNDLENIEVAEEDEPFEDLVEQEELPIDHHHNNVTIEYAKIHNYDNSGADTTYDSIGFRYSYRIFNMPFIKRRTLQDSVALELGIFYYNIAPFRDPNGTDSLTLLSPVGTVRYNLLVDKNFTFFVYAGALRNMILQNNAVNASYLANTRLALGGGMMLTIGPSWAIRLDYGTDLFGIGAVIKF